MKTYKTIGILAAFIVVCIIGTGMVYLFTSAQQDTAPTQDTTQKKQIIAESVNNLKTVKKAIESYTKQRNHLPDTEILLEEIVKLADLDLSQGSWDEMGVYTTEYFIYIGGCYSTWCYAEANRKNNFYSLQIRHNGKKWDTKVCTTQNTELGREVCRHLRKHGWKYQDGEI